MAPKDRAPAPRRCGEAPPQRRAREQRPRPRRTHQSGTRPLTIAAYGTRRNIAQLPAAPARNRAVAVNPSVYWSATADTAWNERGNKTRERSGLASQVPVSAERMEGADDPSSVARRRIFTDGQIEGGGGRRTPRGHAPQRPPKPPTPSRRNPRPPLRPWRRPTQRGEQLRSSLFRFSFAFDC
jgi:hypothetical protein